MTKRKDTRNEERKRKQQQEQSDRANSDPHWRNVTEQMRQDFLEAVAKIHNVDARGEPLVVKVHSDS